MGPTRRRRSNWQEFIILELPSIDACLEWAARCPGASIGAVEVGRWPLKPCAGGSQDDKGSQEDIQSAVGRTIERVGPENLTAVVVGVSFRPHARLGERWRMPSAKRSFSALKAWPRDGPPQTPKPGCSQRTPFTHCVILTSACLSERADARTS